MKKLANYAVIGLILVALVAITSCGTPFGINTAINGKCYVHYDGSKWCGIYFDSQSSYTYYEIKQGDTEPSVANHFTDYGVSQDTTDKSLYYVDRPNLTTGNEVKVWKISKDNLNKIYRNNNANTEYTRVTKDAFVETFKKIGKESWKTVNGVAK